MTPTEAELLPCPFCGGEATLTMIGNVHSTRKCIVKCSGCRYQRTDAALRYGDEWLRNTAIAAWNRRTPRAAELAASRKPGAVEGLVAKWRALADDTRSNKPGDMGPMRLQQCASDLESLASRPAVDVTDEMVERAWAAGCAVIGHREPMDDDDRKALRAALTAALIDANGKGE